MPRVATQLNAVGVAQSDLVLGTSEARDGQVALGEHFAAGSGSPVSVIVAEGELQQAADILPRTIRASIASASCLRAP